MSYERGIVVIRPIFMSLIWLDMLHILVLVTNAKLLVTYGTSFVISVCVCGGGGGRTGESVGTCRLLEKSINRKHIFLKRR